MSMRKLRRFMRRQTIRIIVWGGIFFIFLLGTFASFGLRQTNPNLPEPPPDIIAKVNGEPIRRDAFHERLADAASISPSPANWIFIKNLVFNQIVEEITAKQAARRYGVRVSRGEVDEKIEKAVDEAFKQEKNKHRSPKDFRDFIRKRYRSEENFREELMSRYRTFRDEFERQIMMDKLRQKVEGELKLTRKDYIETVTRVHPARLVVKASRFLKDKKNPSPQEKEEAERKANERANQLLERIKKGEKFEELVKKESDDDATKKKGGDLGWLAMLSVEFMYGRPFYQTIRKMKVGEVEGPVKHEEGYQLIKLVEKKVELPKDYHDVRYQCQNKKCKHEWTAKPKAKECQKCKGKKIKVVSRRKKEVFEQFVSTRKTQHWFDFQRDLSATAKVELFDYELAGYKAALEGKTEDAIRFYKKALKYAGTELERFTFPAPLCYELGSLYEQKKRFKDAIKAYKQALEHDEHTDILLKLGELLTKQKQKKQALTYLQRAAEMPLSPTEREKLEGLFKELGEKKLAEQQRKLREQEKKQQPTPGG